MLQQGTVRPGTSASPKFRGVPSIEDIVTSRSVESIALLFVDHVNQRQPFAEAPDVFLEECLLAVAEFVGGTGEVRSDHHVVKLPQRVTLRQRLRVGYIQP